MTKDRRKNGQVDGKSTATLTIVVATSLVLHHLQKY
jgi:hypothetical protein